MEIIEAIKYVDKVVPERDLDKIKSYHTYNFNVMFAGNDYINEEIYIQQLEILKQFGVETIY